MTKISKSIKLNSGYSIPTIGLGTWLLSTSEAPSLVYKALDAGYRHLDTAIYYGNEREVGEGIAKWISDDPSRKRDDVFYTSKLWTFNTYSRAKEEIERAFSQVEHSLGYIDLLLLHSPMGGPEGRLAGWKALQEAVEEGKVKSIGVSSWGAQHIDQLYAWDGLTIEPAVNQFEVHPWCMRTELSEFCKKKGIHVESYSPLAHGERLKDATVVTVAKKYGVTPAQLLLRWNLQKGNIILPKTSNPDRLSSNLDLFGFELADEDVKLIEHPEVHEPTDWECTNMP
ncbi:CYFA0S08e01926g1_1 [Cyberlindnera fabianii]|uniref:CYFA0S08e01926g1_1 n=1 Tax=Cyberlindnera fabianii TaxID=36022 RepID=A0A061AWB4_CYBFA|nr:CYFA0S08e01926g1_1 [Cyberlindnera fabianii]